eukprot:2525311-Rhodomonas_salina.1
MRWGGQVSLEEEGGLDALTEAGEGGEKRLEWGEGEVVAGGGGGGGGGEKGDEKVAKAAEEKGDESREEGGEREGGGGGEGARAGLLFDASEVWSALGMRRGYQPPIALCLCDAQSDTDIRIRRVLPYGYAAATRCPILTQTRA